MQTDWTHFSILIVRSLASLHSLPSSWDHLLVCMTLIFAPSTTLSLRGLSLLFVFYFRKFLVNFKPYLEIDCVLFVGCFWYKQVPHLANELTSCVARKAILFCFKKFNSYTYQDYYPMYYIFKHILNELAAKDLTGTNYSVKLAHCQQLCTNIPGSYQWACRDEYYLSYDKKSCLVELSFSRGSEPSIGDKIDRYNSP